MPSAVIPIAGRPNCVVLSLTGSATSPERILLGNGTSELIWLICLAVLRPQDRVMVPEPTYGEYARSAAMMRARVVPLRTSEQDRFILDPERMRSELRAWQPRLAVPVQSEQSDRNGVAGRADRRLGRGVSRLPVCGR